MDILNVSYDVFTDAAALSNVYFFNAPNGSVIATAKSGGFIFFVNISDGYELSDFSANIEPIATEVFKEDDAVGRSALDNEIISKFDVGDTYTYVGVARPGSADTDLAWKISRYSFNAEGDPTDEKISKSGVAWSNRGSVIYY